MTLLPCEPILITVPPQDSWPKEEMPTICQVPGCSERGELGYHHIVRRSHTGRPVDFVTIGGLVLDNRMKICTSHHGDVSDHRAWVVYVEGRGWCWFTRKLIIDRWIELSDWRVKVQPKSQQVFYYRGDIEYGRT